MNKYENNKEFIRIFIIYIVYLKIDFIFFDKIVLFLIYKKLYW